MENIFQNLRVRRKFSIREAMKGKLFVVPEIHYSELRIFSFNSYVLLCSSLFYYFNSCFWSPSSCFNLPTRAFNLPTRTFDLATHALSLLTAGFELVTRGVELVTRGFDFVTRRSELVIHNSKFVFYFSTKWMGEINWSGDKLKTIYHTYIQFDIIRNF